MQKFKVRFDQFDPKSQEGASSSPSQTSLDYSPLPLLTWRSFSMGVLVSMGGLILGYDTGQISGFLEMPDFLRRFGQEQPDGAYQFTSVRSGLIVGMLSVGTLFGALLAAPIADRWGRRPSISGWNVVVSVGFVIQISANNSWEQVMLGRFVTGWGVGALSVLVSMFQAETSPPWVRGALVCAYQLFITLGLLLAALFNYATYLHQRENSISWRLIIGLGWAWTLILGIGVWGFDETPRFVYGRGYPERARQTLMKVYNAPAHHYSIHLQMEEFREKRETETPVRQSGVVEDVVQMFKAPRMTHRILLGIALQGLQQLTGANFFFYYGTTIFASFDISSYITQIILNALNFSLTFLGLYFVEHYGRRKPLLVGSVWMFICFMVFATVGHFQLDIETPSNTPVAGAVMIVFACIFILGFATTWGAMIWLCSAEIWPSKYRARGIAISASSNWIWNFFLGFCSPFITNAIDFRYGYIFAACNLFGGVVIYFFLMETQGRTLEEVDTMYVSKIDPRKSAQWVAPTTIEVYENEQKGLTMDSQTAPGSSIGGSSTVEGASSKEAEIRVNSV